MRNGYFIQSGIVGYSRDESLKLLSKFLPGSIVLFKEDFKDQKDLAALMKRINQIYKIDHGVQEPYFAIDQEGGKIVQLSWTEYNPSNAFLGYLNNVKFSEYMGLRVGYDLEKNGFSWHLAPDMDLSNMYNPVILERSFSGEADVVAANGTAYLRGVQRTGVAATAKHFPCHGGVTADSHMNLPVDSRDKDSIWSDMFPFREATRNGVSAIMMGHILYPAMDKDFPSSLSITFYDVLRDDLNFSGVIITDSMDMQAITKGFSTKELTRYASRAGADMLETVEIDQAMEIVDFLDMKDAHASQKRLYELQPHTRINFEPPAELLHSMLLTHNDARRPDEHLDPSVETGILFLKEERESLVEEVFSNSDEVMTRLSNQLLLRQVLEMDVQKSKFKQFLIVGRNEHIKKRIRAILKKLNGKKCIFISTGVPFDIGLFELNCGYISLRSTRVESVLGGIYRAFGFF